MRWTCHERIVVKFKSSTQDLRLHFPNIMNTEGAMEFRKNCDMDRSVKNIQISHNFLKIDLIFVKNIYDAYLGFRDKMVPPDFSQTCFFEKCDIYRW